MLKNVIQFGGVKMRRGEQYILCTQECSWVLFLCASMGLFASETDKRALPLLAYTGTTF
jgi:hypothetical protein